MTDEASNLLVDATKRVGTTLRGKYTLEALLGIGGMAAVYRAVHRNGHRVAVKVLHAVAASSADIRTRFLREGYVANRVEHAGAVRVTDDDTAEDGTVFLVMELLEGETIESIADATGGKLAVRDVAILGWQLLDILAAAHANGIVHRDIKPDNVFLTKSDTLKVLDFGIARLVDPLSGAATTHTGNMVGTPAFMAPEQALGQAREIDARTDLWAVGATLFTLASGAHVHDADTVAAMVVYAGSRKARRVHEVAPDVPKALADVIDRALAFDKAERFPDAKTMQAEIADAFRASFGGDVSKESLSLVPRAPKLSLPDTSSVAMAPTMDSGAHPAVTPKGIATIGGTASDRAKKSARSPVTIGAIVLALGLGLALVYVVSQRAPSVTPAATASATTPSATATATVVITASAAASTIAAPAETMSTAIAASSVTPEPRSPHVVKPSTSAKAAPAASTVPATAATTNCDPPYTIDGQGHRIPKAGCY